MLTYFSMHNCIDNPGFCEVRSSNNWFQPQPLCVFSRLYKFRGASRCVRFYFVITKDSHGTLPRVYLCFCLRYILRLHLRHASILFASVSMYFALISKFKLCALPSFLFGKPKRRHYSYTIRWNQSHIFHPFQVFSYVFIDMFIYFLFSWACAFVSLPHSELRPVREQISNSLFLRNEADFPNDTRFCSRLSEDAYVFEIIRTSIRR